MTTKRPAAFAVLFTFLGAAPLWIYCVLPSELRADTAIQFSIMAYVAMIISFIGGLQWAVATQQQSYARYINAILLNAIPWFLVLLAFTQHIPFHIFWFGCIVILIFQWLIDNHLLPLTTLADWFTKLRTLGSIIMILSIMLVLLRS